MKEVKLLIDYANINKNDVVLDVGCGLGDTDLDISSVTGCNIVGIDVNFDEYRINSEKVVFYHMDSESIHLGDSAFDKCIMIHSIGHFKNPEKVLINLRKTLKDGAIVALVTPNLYFIKSYSIPHKFSSYLPDDTVVTFFSKRRLKKLFTKNGFKVKVAKTYGRKAFGILPIKEGVIFVAVNNK